MLPAKLNCHNEVSFKRFVSVRTHKTKKITQSCYRRKMEEKEDDTKISIADPIQDHQETTFSFDFRTEFLQDENKTPFFKPRSRRRRRDTCVIFAFVIIHLVVFLITMAVNDCGYNSHGDCAFKALGRMSFQPLLENPFLGPSASAWALFFLSWSFCVSFLKIGLC